ncbi:MULTISPECIES: TetR/AcrR family transcriptional regulator [Streptomyces]|uniref:TetR/AcrR family transcriptional regulator n=1 Tax=Streptomyces TaxID=1883 RepID=UPI000A3B41D3|nr:TetR/AcrR family transcriptional regulator [Streptomyces sp. NRRL B-24572]
MADDGGRDAVEAEYVKAEYPTGLREKKKARTRQALSDAAIALFMEKGFDGVSVAEVAAAAEVSKPTLFRYFPAKEDLVLHRFADHEGESARVVEAGRVYGTAPLDALYEHLLEGLERRDPVTGLCDVPAVLAYHRLLYGTPALLAAIHGYQQRSEEVLAKALGGDPLVARLAAGQIVAVLRVLANENVARLTAGDPIEEVGRDAVTAAGEAFRSLRQGLPY